MDDSKNIIKRDRAEKEVLAFQPRTIELGLTESAKVYLNEENRKKSGFILSELIAKQTGVAHLESESHKELVEKEVLVKLKEVQESAYQEAHALGREEGAKAAFAEKKNELEQKIEEFGSILEEMKRLRSQVLKAQEKELVELVFQIGKKIALRDLSEDSSTVKELIETILLECEKEEEIKIYLSPLDKEFISSKIESGDFKIGDLGQISLLEDEKMTDGGCRVQTKHGSINSQVEQRVENIWNSLKSRMPRTEGGSN